MTIQEAIEQRRSIRRFRDQALRPEDKAFLEEEIARLNAESGLHMQLQTEREDAFRSLMAHYGGFRNARNYVALVGPADSELDEKCGYYGEQIVLAAWQRGIASCWVGGTFNKRKAFYDAAPGEKLCLIIALGYADEEGRVHKCKPHGQVTNAAEPMPLWFEKGLHAALLAPTAINQQKFFIELGENEEVTIKAGRGPFAKVDLGIVKCHFELGSGKKL